MNKKTLAWAATLVLSLVSGMPVAQAQYSYPGYAPPPSTYSQDQLDQMLAPVALYPDSLLAQVLMASTYPLEVVQAQRFVEARPGLQGDGLARAVAPMPWDPSVKALVQFPSVLAMMNDRLDWTQQMGQAFLAQQGNVMDTVQQLRERAQVAGSLQNGPQQRVLVEDDVIVIEPANPQVVYVPYYNPVVAYGDWWWPQRPPVAWTPPPRYRPPHYSPGVTVGIAFGSGIGLTRAAFGDARPDWRQRQMMVTQTRFTNVTNNVTNHHVTNNVTINRNVTVSQRPVVWHHDPRYGRGQPQPGQPLQRPDDHRQDHPDDRRGPPPALAQQQVIQQDRARADMIRQQDAARQRGQQQDQQREQQQRLMQQQQDEQRQVKQIHDAQLRDQQMRASQADQARQLQQRQHQIQQEQQRRLSQQQQDEQRQVKQTHASQVRDQQARARQADQARQMQEQQRQQQDQQRRQLQQQQHEQQQQQQRQAYEQQRQAQQHDQQAREQQIRARQAEEARRRQQQ